MRHADSAAARAQQHLPEDILVHDKFPVARERFINAVLTLYENDAFLTRLVVEAARQLTFSTILCLDARSDPDDPETWPTLRQVKQQMAQFGVSSPRRIESLVGLLIHNGFIKSIASPRDGRLRVLMPTAKMLATDQGWWAAHFLPLQMMFPDPGYDEVLRGDPLFHRALRRVATRFFGHGAKILERNPDIMLFMERDAGTLVLFKLAQMAHAPGNPAIDPDYEDIATRFGVSRTHVQKIMQDAVRAGLMTVTSRGRLVALTPTIWRALDRFIADSMAGNDMMFNIARHEMAAPAAAQLEALHR